jgi:hypothetical protein
MVAKALLYKRDECLAFDVTSKREILSINLPVAL